MKAPHIKLPAGATGYLVLGLGGIAAVYVVVRFVVPAIAKAGAKATTTALNTAATLPAAAVTAAGSAVGSTLDAFGDELLGASTYNAIPNTWGGVWDKVKGWFGESNAGNSGGVNGTTAGGPSQAPASAGSGSIVAGPGADVLAGSLSGVSGGW